MAYTPEELEHFSMENQGEEEKTPYTKRPLSHVILAWILIAIVLFAFFGSCYWMVQYGRV